MLLRTWLHSTDGARSAENTSFLDGLLHRGCKVAPPGATISINETVEQDVPLIQLSFKIPEPCHSTGVSSIPVWVPRTCVGTNFIQPNVIFYALSEETIGWLAGVGPKHSLCRLYGPNNRQHVQSFSSDWHQVRDRFHSFISSLRETHTLFPVLGQMSGAFGTIEVARAMTRSGEIAMGYTVTLALSSGNNMVLYLPIRVAQLPRQWVLDWLEVQVQFARVE
jgi:hypothetical protein